MSYPHDYAREAVATSRELGIIAQSYDRATLTMSDLVDLVAQAYRSGQDYAQHTAAEGAE